MFSKAHLFPPHLVATSLHTLTRVTFAMAGRLVRLLVVEFFGVCVLFWGFSVLFFFSGFFPSFPCIYACGVYASSLRTLLGTLRLAWGYHRASGKSWPCRHGTFPASSSCGSPSSFIASPWSCPVFARGGKTPCICS